LNTEHPMPPLREFPPDRRAASKRQLLAVIDNEPRRRHLLRPTPPARRSRPWLIAAASAGIAVLVFASLATAGAFGPFGPLHGASISPSPPTLPTSASSDLACRLIGQTAGTAETLLSQSGYKIEWRFQHWGTQTAQNPDGSTPGAITGGYATTPSTVPTDSVVWDIGTDNRSAKALFVFVEAPNDPNAPTITAPNCHGG
jgi:hypothetical protein